MAATDKMVEDYHNEIAVMDAMFPRCPGIIQSSGRRYCFGGWTWNQTDQPFCSKCVNRIEAEVVCNLCTTAAAHPDDREAILSTADDRIQDRIRFQNSRLYRDNT